MARLKAAQRRDQLLAIATRLFAKSGFDATTTASIAKAAGVTEPILYRHFSSKRGLFIAILRRTSSLTLQRIAELAAESTDPLEQMKIIADRLPKTLTDLYESYQLLHGALANCRDQQVIKVIRQYYKNIEAFFVTIIEKGQKSGQFSREVPPALVAWSLIYTCLGFSMIHISLKPKHDISVEQFIHYHIRGLYA